MNWFRVIKARALSAEAYLIPIDLYIMQTQSLAVIRWAIRDSKITILWNFCLADTQ